MNYQNSRLSGKIYMALICLFLHAFQLSAQRPAQSFGIGFQAGNPTGLSMQFYRQHGVSTDILLAYDWRDFFFLNVHGLWNVHLDEGQHLHLFYGPGGFIGIRDYKPDYIKDEVVAGLSGDFGLNLVVSRLEFYGQATPRIALTPGTYFSMGGGVGIRFFF